MAKKKKRSKSKSKSRLKTQTIGVKTFVFLVGVVGMSILFLPTTFLLAVGLLPTFVAVLVDPSPGKNKAFTIGAMNFAGCFYYLLELWTNSNSIEAAVFILSDPATIIIMYGLAGLGYVVNWATTLGVAAVLVERGEKRIARIGREKKKLEERWGVEVNGKYTLDESGFKVVSDVVDDGVKEG